MRFALLASAVVLALIAWSVSVALTPIDHGIDRSAYPGSEHTEEAIEPLLPRRGERAPPRPNVIVILADDLGYGDLGVQGSRAIETPQIDRIAAEGLRLTQFYASAPVCSPSRAGLLTGRYPLRSGIVAALQAADDTFLRSLMYRAGIAFAKLAAVDLAGGDNAVRGLPPSEITIAEGLRVAGYRTMAIGKWHLGDFTQLPEYHPSNHGFDRFVGFNMSNDDWPVAFWRDQQEIVEDIGLDQAHYTRLFTEEAVKFIEEASDAPFFLYLAHKDPHQPFFPSGPFVGRTAGGPYGDSVSEFDWSVGQVVEAVRRAGVANDTLVVMTSDNGPWYEGSPGGLRGRKGQSYEGGFRVPFVAWWPGQIQAGSVSDAPAMNIDLLPTLLGLAGLEGPVDREIDGEDQWPIWSGSKAATSERALYFFHDYDIEAMRLGKWKYIDRNSHYVWPVPLDKPDTPGGRMIAGRDYQPPGASESVPTLGTWPLLYDLDVDPDEAYNVARSNLEVAKVMRERLEAWRRSFTENPRGWH
ncbi:MAG: sulfatase [Myxococcota bacterium]|jgi:uncharacterized sulfatase|nr:sulfatase [Myxococcota bacterium]